MVNLFNRNKKEENTPNDFEKEILGKLEEQLEFNQVLLKKISTLENNYQKLNNQFPILKENIHDECEVVHRKISIESRKLNEQLLCMNNINLTHDDIRKFIDIGYEYLQKEYEFEIVPDNNADGDVGTIKKDDPVTITEVLEYVENGHVPETIDTRKSRNKPVTETRPHLLNIAKSLRHPYQLKLLANGHFKNKNKPNTKQTKFTIHNVLDLKKNIPYYYEKGFDFKTICLRYPRLSPTVVKRLIWNIEEGYLDEAIEEYTKGTDDKPTNKLAFNINQRYCKPYRITKLDGIDIYRKGQGSSKLGFNILDVLYVKENLPRWIKERTPRAQVVEETGMAPDRLQRVIYNVQEGLFDSYLEEFEDLDGEHKFTIVNNNLYIDTNDTGLDISSVRMIIHDYNNATNKYNCIKNLIRTYHNTNAYYIILITRYCVDSGFRDLVLHNSKDSITVVNNPEKRRDYGTSLVGI